MGGFGSGRRIGANDTTDGCRSIDVRRWQRDGLLSPGRSFSWKWTRNNETVATIGVKADTGRLWLDYRARRYGEEWESMKYPVMLEMSPCHFGGFRYWFRCPASGCTRRVALLYLGGSYFACRHCYQLAYASQREAPHDRVARRAERIRERLGWKPGILNGSGRKPKGMHWKTFWRLQAEHDTFVDASLNGMMVLLGIALGR